MPDNQGLTTGLVQTQLAKTLCGTESTPSKAKPKATHSSFGVPDDGLDIRDKPVVVLGVVGETLLEPSPEVLPTTIVHRHRLSSDGLAPPTLFVYLSFLSRSFSLPLTPLLGAASFVSSQEFRLAEFITGPPQRAYPLSPPDRVLRWEGVAFAYRDQQLDYPP